MSIGPISGGNYFNPNAANPANGNPLNAVVRLFRRLFGRNGGIPARQIPNHDPHYQRMLDQLAADVRNYANDATEH